MPNFPIQSGVFNLPAGLAQRLLSATVTAQQANTSVTILNPDGSTLWQSLGMPNGAQVTLSQLNGPALPPGAYTIIVTGKAAGTLTTE